MPRRAKPAPVPVALPPDVTASYYAPGRVRLTRTLHDGARVRLDVAVGEEADAIARLVAL